MRYVIAQAACLSALLFSVSARADGQDDIGWRYRAELVTASDVLGYEPAYVVSDLGDETYDGHTAPHTMTHFSATIVLQGDWLWLDFRPYTHSEITATGIQMSLGGLEARLAVPFTLFTRKVSLGFYHHSAHNFSREGFGFGINLNSFFLDVALVDTKFAVEGSPAHLELHSVSHVFAVGDGSPYLFTEDTVVHPGDISRSSWRKSLSLEGEHRYGRFDLSGIANGDERGRMVSVLLHLPVTARLRFFPAPFGEHVFLGPYVSFGWNMYNVEQFGSVLWSAGIQFDLVLVDNTI